MGLPALLLLLIGTLEAQDGGDEMNPLEDIEPTEGQTLLVEDFEWLRDHKIDLNRASAGEIAQLPALSQHEAILIERYRERFGKFSSTDQLFLVPDVDSSVVQGIIPYLKVIPTETENNDEAFLQIRTRSSRSVELSRGYTEGIYLGSPFKNYARIDCGFGETVEGGLLVEKDAGERSSDGFVSGYLSARNLGFISRVVIGDYRIETGQGLVLWEGSGFGKGGDPVRDALKKPRGIIPHRSTDEFSFLRGIGVEAMSSTRDVTLTARAFYSYRKLAASAGDDGQLTGYYEAGLFRTSSELEKRGRADLRLFGGNVKVSVSGGFSVEGVVYRDIGGISTGDVIGGLNAAFQRDGVGTFAEVGGEMNHRAAWLMGVTFPGGRGNAILLLCRNYPASSERFHTMGFGEREGTDNEKGYYIGFRIRPFSWLTGRGYLDLYRFPFKTPTIPFSAEGNDLLLHGIVHLSKSLNISLRFKAKKGQTDVLGEDRSGRNVISMQNRIQQSIRITADYSIEKGVRYRFRIDRTSVDYQPGGSAEEGILMYHDLRFGLSPDLTVQARVIFFHTDSYDSRIYEYEADVPGVLSIPPLYGRGKRWYCVFKYQPSKGWTFSVKYAETLKDGSSSIGSGLSEIPGDTGSRVDIQADFHF